MTPEQKAREQIDAKLRQSGWVIQNMDELNPFPTGIFYNPGVKANVIFFDKRPASSETQTKEVWIKDKALANLDNLPEPDVLADDIIENLQSALESFEELKAQLRS